MIHKTPEQARIYELEELLLTLTAWMTQVPGALGRQDYRKMADLIVANREKHSFREADVRAARRALEGAAE